MEKTTTAGVFIVSYSYVDATGEERTVSEDVIGYSPKGAAQIIQQYLSECNYQHYKITDAKLKEKIILVG